MTGPWCSCGGEGQRRGRDTQGVLEQVWAAVAREALTMIFTGADATGFEEDARLTAMWLWTLKTGETNGNGAPSEEEPDEDEEESSGKESPLASPSNTMRPGRSPRASGHTGGLDSRRRGQGRDGPLFPVAERTGILFGSAEADASTATRKKKDPQLKLALRQTWSRRRIWWLGSERRTPPRQHRPGPTTQAMILFAAGRGEALKRFLVEEVLAAMAVSGAWPRRSRPSILPRRMRNAGRRVLARKRTRILS